MTLALLLSLLLGGSSQADWPQQRLDMAREQAAAELADFYCSGDNWYRCWRALQRLERLERWDLRKNETTEGGLAADFGQKKREV